MVLSEPRETIVLVFQARDYLFNQFDDIVNMFKPPLELFDYLWATYVMQDQRNKETMLAQDDLRSQCVPSAPLNVYFALLQDSKYRLNRQGQ